MISRILLWLEYLNRTLTNSGELPHWIMAGIRSHNHYGSCLYSMFIERTALDHRLKLVFKVLLICIFYLLREQSPSHCLSLEQDDQWKSCRMHAHILYFRWLEILGLMANFEPKVGNFESVEILSQGLGSLAPNFVSDQSRPNPIPWSPLRRIKVGPTLSLGPPPPPLDITLIAA